MAEYLNREAAIKAFNNFDAGRADSPPFTLLTPEEFAEHLYELPTADVTPVVHGYWIEKKSAAGRYFECSNCGAHENKHTAIKGYYCWRCGAKMDKRNEPEN